MRPLLPTAESRLVLGPHYESEMLSAPPQEPEVFPKYSMPSQATGPGLCHPFLLPSTELTAGPPKPWASPQDGPPQPPAPPTTGGAHSLQGSTWWLPRGFSWRWQPPGLAQVQRDSLSVSTARKGATPRCPRPCTAAGRRHRCGQLCSCPGQARTPLSLPPEAQCASQARFLTTRRWQVLPG